MKADVKEKWLAALRGGEYKRRTGALRRDGGYCCLGVLCDIIHPEGWAGDIGDFVYDHGESYNGFLPAGFAREVGLDIATQRELARRNDARVEGDVPVAVHESYDAVIPYIEEHL